MDESGKLIAIIGDEVIIICLNNQHILLKWYANDNNILNWSQDTVTGFILAGIGHRTVDGENFLVVKPGTLYLIIY